MLNDIYQLTGPEWKRFTTLFEKFRNHDKISILVHLAKNEKLEV